MAVARVERSAPARRRIASGALAVVVAAGVLLAGYYAWQSYQRSAGALARQGVLAYKNLAFDRAIILWQRSLATNPAQPELRYYLAQALESTGATAEAVVEYEKAITLNPKLVLPRFNLASLYLKTGEVEKAKNTLVEAVAMAPHFAAAHYLLGDIYRQQGDLEAAAAAYCRVIELGQEGTFHLADVYLQLGNVYLLQGKAGEAREAWQRVLLLDPGNQAAAVNLTKF